MWLENLRHIFNRALVFIFTWYHELILYLQCIYWLAVEILTQPHRNALKDICYTTGVVSLRISPVLGPVKPR